MTPQGGDIRCTRLGEQPYLPYILISPTIAVRQVQVCGGAYLILNICKRLCFLYFGIGGAVTGRVHRMTPQGGDIRCTRLGEQLFLSDMLIPPPIAVPVPNPERTHFTVEHGYVCAVCCKMLAFSVTGFGQICARWRAVVVTYNKSTDCANMTKAVRLKCSGGVGYG